MKFKLITAGILSLLASGATAQNYPSKDITVIVPYAAGGTVDTVARTVADQMSEDLGQKIVVVPKPGAGGALAAAEVLGSKPDGYTFLMGAQFVTTAPIINPQTAFKTEQFEAVAAVGAPPNVFVVPADLGIDTMEDFLAYAKENDGKLNTANMGTGGSNHLGMETLLYLTGLDIRSISYQSSPAAVPDLLRGDLQIVLLPLSVALPHIQSGAVKALAVNAPERVPSLPDTPSLVEAGLSEEVVVLPWFGFFAPEGTPVEIRQTFNEAVNKAIENPAVREKLDALNAVLINGPMEDFEALVIEEVARWDELVSERGISVK